MKKTSPIPTRQTQPVLHGDRASLTAEFISILPLTRDKTLDPAQTHHSEALFHIFAHRLVMAQEAERSRLSLELHDHITQLVCATILRCQKLAGQLVGNEKAHADALELGNMMGQAAEEVERISRHLRPGVLETLGLVAAMRASSAEFAARTGLVITPSLSPLSVTLPPETDLALYRILQEALRNVEQHAQANLVTVRLLQQPATIELTIEDDGIGFDPDKPATVSKGVVGVGLVGMRERATCVGGALQVVSAPDKGTLIRAQIPLTPIGTPAPYAPPYYRSAS